MLSPIVSTSIVGGSLLVPDGIVDLPDDTGGFVDLPTLEGSVHSRALDVVIPDVSPGQVIEFEPLIDVVVPENLVVPYFFTAGFVVNGAISKRFGSDPAEGVAAWTIRPPAAASAGTAHTHGRRHRISGPVLSVVRAEDIELGSVRIRMQYSAADGGGIEPSISSDPDDGSSAPLAIARGPYDRRPGLRVLLDGQSLVNLSTGLGSDEGLAEQLIRRLRSDPYAMSTSAAVIAISGYRFDDRATGRDQRIEPHTIAFEKNLLVSWGGVSDSISLFGGQSGADTLADHEAAVASARSFGVDFVIGLTIPPVIGLTATEFGKIDDYNALLLESTAFDEVVDTRVAELDDRGTYPGHWADNLHLAESGLALVIDKLAPAVASYYGR